MAFAGIETQFRMLPMQRQANLLKIANNKETFTLVLKQ